MDKNASAARRDLFQKPDAAKGPARPEDRSGRGGAKNRERRGKSRNWELQFAHFFTAAEDLFDGSNRTILY